MGVIPRVGSSPTSGTRRAGPSARTLASRTVNRASTPLILVSPLLPSHCRAGGPAYRRYMSRILVAEDDADVAEVVKLALEDGGHACSVARDGAETLELARQELPDLLILDLGMPKLSGDAVLACLREEPRTRYIPAIVLTARTGSSDK